MQRLKVVPTSLSINLLIMVDIGWTTKELPVVETTSL